MTNIDLTDSEVQEFKPEAVDLLDQAEQNLLGIEKGSPFSTAYDAIFRAFHSIKGAGGMLGWTSLQDHMHQLESHFQACKGKSNLSKPQTTYFLKGIDTTRTILDGKDFKFDYTFPEGEAPGTIPIAKPQAVAPTPDAVKALTPSDFKNQMISREEPSSLLRAFVIDDEPDVVELISDILKSSGFEIEGFSDPRVAQARIKKMKPDVVISDMKMPGLTGMDILKLVNAEDPDLPVVFVSGYLSKELIIESISFGVYAVIEKPFSEAQVVSVCVSAAQRCRVMRLLNRS
ncbi:MAG: response regulator, partial [Bdellovibrionota bacterium]